MEFRTELTAKRSTNPILLSDSIVTVGSCFSDAIGNRLKNFKFNVSVNPFGTIYNPLSIHSLLIRSVENEPLSHHSFIQQNEVHANYHFHSQFNALSQKELEANLASKLSEARQQLSAASFILITYGTAWVYKLRESGEVVSNCHKMPAVLFEKQLLTSQQIAEDFERLITTLRKVNNDAKIILTVSPVRHVKDTLTLNSVSKSILRLACHELTQRYSHVEYFPAFEIMMDDLRDYRFYKDDLIHPTEFAENYIWQQFAGSYFSEDTQLVLKKWSDVASALQHKPFQPQSPTYQHFLRATLTKLEELKNQVDVTKEREFIEQQLNQFKIQG